MRLKEEAGWNQTARDWERFLAASPGGCFAAERDAQVVGTATTIVYGGRLAWISMVLVDRRYRGEGIGTALLGKAISHLDTQGIPTMKLDATPQGRPLYEKLGFQEEYCVERWTLQREQAALRARPPGPAVPPSGGLEEILPLDRVLFGAERGDLLRALAAEEPRLLVTARPGGARRGYALGRRGSDADHLGPWAAEDAAAARETLKEFLERTDRPRVIVDQTCANPWIRGVLEEAGFQHSRPLTRMYRGINDSAGQPERLCGIVGPEFG
jgi:predicted GNAT family acetyltransferase